MLAPSPDILLLDEPTNHLDLTTIEWLERELDGRRTALVIISHDRRFLSTCRAQTVWLDRGATRRIERGFAHFEEWRDMLLAEEEREQHKLDRKIVAEEHWMRYGVTARRKRNMRRVGELQALRERRRSYRAAAGDATITAGAAAPSGVAGDRGRTASARAMASARSCSDFSIRIQRGDRIGIVGPNGSGKTTLINMLTGALAPDSGTVRLGANLAIATLDQHRDSLDPDVTVADALTGGGGDTVMVNGAPKHVVGYMKDFLFASEQARTPLGKLSGGERGRLMLAQALAKPSNLLVLDEPTNDLDMETLDVLEDMLGDYPGTVLLISHDRDFLDRLVERRDRAGRRRPLDRICRRLFRHAGAARRRSHAATPRKAEAAQSRQERLRRRRRRREATPELQGQARAGNAAETIVALQAEAAGLQAKLADPGFYARDRAGFRKGRPPRSATCSTRSPRPRSSGWNSRSCAKNSPGNRPELGFGYFFSR